MRTNERSKDKLLVQFPKRFANISILRISNEQILDKSLKLYTSGGEAKISSKHRSKPNKVRRFLRGRDDQGALSDSECQPTSWRHRYLKDANSNHTKVLEYVASPKSQSGQDSPSRGHSKSRTIESRGGSLNLGKESQRYRDKLKQEGRFAAAAADDDDEDRLKVNIYTTQLNSRCSIFNFKRASLKIQLFNWVIARVLSTN